MSLHSDHAFRYLQCTDFDSTLNTRILAFCLTLTLSSITLPTLPKTFRRRYLVLGLNNMKGSVIKNLELSILKIIKQNSFVQVKTFRLSDNGSRL